MDASQDEVGRKEVQKNGCLVVQKLFKGERIIWGEGTSNITQVKEIVTFKDE